MKNCGIGAIFILSWGFCCIIPHRYRKWQQDSVSAFSMIPEISSPGSPDDSHHCPDGQCLHGRRKCLEAGMNANLPKPMDVEKLCGMIERLRK